jgi:hypothetical protein
MLGTEGNLLENPLESTVSPSIDAINVVFHYSCAVSIIHEVGSKGPTEATGPIHIYASDLKRKINVV